MSTPLFMVRSKWKARQSHHLSHAHPDPAQTKKHRRRISLVSMLEDRRF